METAGGFLAHALETLRALGVWGYWIILLVALADSLVIVGTFTTGTAFLLLAGVLVSQGVYEFADMAIFASVGAMLGGLISYSLGKSWTHLLFIQRHQSAKKKHMERSARLLERYGGAGVVLGRFLGPLGSLTAFIAGFSNMPRRAFIFWNILAGLAWGVGYVLIGTLLGESFVYFHLF